MLLPLPLTHQADQNPQGQLGNISLPFIAHILGPAQWSSLRWGWGDALPSQGCSATPLRCWVSLPHQCCLTSLSLGGADEEKKLRSSPALEVPSVLSSACWLRWTSRKWGNARKHGGRGGRAVRMFMVMSFLSGWLSYSSVSIGTQSELWWVLER